MRMSFIPMELVNDLVVFGAAKTTDVQTNSVTAAKANRLLIKTPVAKHTLNPG